jgi:chemotaxis protein CheX
MQDLMTLSIDALVACTRDVFEMMVARELTFRGSFEGTVPRPKSNVVGTVGFAGAQSGLVAFYSMLAGAHEIAGAMLGMAPADVDGEMPDAIGEVTNMVAGAFRTKMTELGYPCDISIPTVTIGLDFYTKYPSDARRVLCQFQMGEHDVFVELIMMTH